MYMNINYQSFIVKRHRPFKRYAVLLKEIRMEGWETFQVHLYGFIFKNPSTLFCLRKMLFKIDIVHNFFLTAYSSYFSLYLFITVCKGKLVYFFRRGD